MYAIVDCDNCYVSCEHRHCASVFIDTNHFREDLPQYWNMAEERLLTPSNSTQQIVQAATRCTERIFRQGYHYKRAGVIVMGISPDNGVQTNFIDYDSENTISVVPAIPHAGVIYQRQLKVRVDPRESP